MLTFDDQQFILVQNLFQRLFNSVYFWRSNNYFHPEFNLESIKFHFFKRNDFSINLVLYLYPNFAYAANKYISTYI